MNQVTGTEVPDPSPPPGLAGPILVGSDLETGRCSSFGLISCTCERKEILKNDCAKGNARASLPGWPNARAGSVLVFLFCSSAAASSSSVSPPPPFFFFFYYLEFLEVTKQRIGAFPPPTDVECVAIFTQSNFQKACLFPPQGFYLFLLNTKKFNCLLSDFCLRIPTLNGAAPSRRGSSAGLTSCILQPWMI